jgi:Holliday junction resolvase-like predicted endonuclease
LAENQSRDHLASVQWDYIQVDIREKKGESDVLIKKVGGETVFISHRIRC